MDVIALSAISPDVTAPVAILEVVTAPGAIFRHMYVENMISGRLCNRLIHRWLLKTNACKTTIFDI